MAFYTVKIQFRNSNLPPFNWTDWWKAPALKRLIGRVQIRAVRLPVLLIELFLQSGCDYRVRTWCISLLKLRQRIGHCGDCAGLTGVIIGTRIVRQLLRIAWMHRWRLEWHDTGRRPARRWRSIPWSKFKLKHYKCSVETFETREWSEPAQISLILYNSS